MWILLWQAIFLIYGDLSQEKIIFLFKDCFLSDYGFINGDHLSRKLVYDEQECWEKCREIPECEMFIYCKND